jgi:hypothetical protein
LQPIEVNGKRASIIVVEIVQERVTKTFVNTLIQKLIQSFQPLEKLARTDTKMVVITKTSEMSLLFHAVKATKDLIKL